MSEIEERILGFADLWGPNPSGQYRRFLDDLRALLDDYAKAKAEEKP